jgi:hypothetical protein
LGQPLSIYWYRDRLQEAAQWIAPLANELVLGDFEQAVVYIIHRELDVGIAVFFYLFQMRHIVDPDARKNGVVDTGRTSLGSDTSE